MVPVLKEDKPTTNKTVKKIAAFEEGIYDEVGSWFSSKNEDQLLINRQRLLLLPFS